jgi:hypothetical protein
VRQAGGGDAAPQLNELLLRDVDVERADSGGVRRLFSCYGHLNPLWSSELNPCWKDTYRTAAWAAAGASAADHTSVERVAQ